MMTDISTDRGTVVAERTLNVPVSRVYAAFADAEERASWGDSVRPSRLHLR